MQNSAFQTDHLVLIAADQDPQKTFMLSKSVLQAASPYFAKPGLLPDSLSAVFGRKYLLPGTDAETLQAFIFYLLNGHKLPRFRLAYTRIAAECDPYKIMETLLAAKITLQSTLVKLWCLAERFGMPQLQDLVILDLWDLLQVCHVQVEALEIALQMTSDVSPLREMMMREFVWNGKEGRYSLEQEDRLGSVSGFTGLVRKIMAECPTAGCEHEPHCAPSKAGVVRYLMAPEGEEQGRRLANLNGC